VIRGKRDYKNSYEATDLPKQENWAGEKFWDISLCWQKRTKLDDLICANSLINRPNHGMKNGVKPPTNAIHIYIYVSKFKKYIFRFWTLQYHKNVLFILLQVQTFLFTEETILLKYSENLARDRSNKKNFWLDY